MKSLSLSAIPGLSEAMAKAKREQFKTREDSLLGLSHNLCGHTVRTMTVMDYVQLERMQSPFLNRCEPTREGLSLFLWVLSPAYAAWRDRTGWRRHFPSLQSLEAFVHSRKVGKDFCQQIPQSSEPVVVRCFEYIDTMFFDAPAHFVNGGESCLSYLTGWFDALQSEYHFPHEVIWKMGLPELFQRLKAIQQRHNPSIPKFNKKEDEVKLWVLTGLRKKEFTMDDLAGGKVKIPDAFTRN